MKADAQVSHISLQEFNHFNMYAMKKVILHVLVLSRSSTSSGLAVPSFFRSALHATRLPELLAVRIISHWRNKLSRGRSRGAAPRCCA